MKEYFSLQLRMMNRKLIEFGLNPILAYVIVGVGFVVFSVFLFSKTEYAVFIYLLSAISILSKLSETRRNDFLRSTFLNKLYYKLRMMENVICVLPFATFLIYKQLFLFALILLIFSLLMALIKVKSIFNFSIPTPFFKKPFEFIVGFRNTFYLVFFAYFLTIMGVAFQNFNLGVFSLLLVFILSLFFYSKLENDFYIWVYALKPKEFLFNKIKDALINSTILIFPITIALSIYFFDDLKILLIFLVLGYVYLITMILAKYSAYPNELNVPQAVLIGISFLFPPFLIVLMPFFYYQSLQRLNSILQ